MNEIWRVERLDALSGDDTSLSLAIMEPPLRKAYLLQASASIVKQG